MAIFCISYLFVGSHWMELLRGGCDEVRGDVEERAKLQPSNAFLLYGWNPDTGSWDVTPYGTQPAGGGGPPGEVRFGSGPDFAAQCPRTVIPPGYRYWNESVDGAVPDALRARAQALASDPSIPLGTTESYPLSGVTALIMVEPHPWTRDDKGAVTPGCFHAAGVYLPAGGAEPPTQPPSESSMGKTIGVLTVASLGVGLVLSVPLLFKGGR